MDTTMNLATEPLLSPVLLSNPFCYRGLPPPFSCRALSKSSQSPVPYVTPLSSLLSRWQSLIVNFFNIVPPSLHIGLFSPWFSLAFQVWRKVLKGNTSIFALDLIVSHSLQDFLLLVIFFLSYTFSLFLSISFSSAFMLYILGKWNKTKTSPILYLSSYCPILPSISKLLESIVFSRASTSASSLSSSILYCLTYPQMASMKLLLLKFLMAF